MLPELAFLLSLALKMAVTAAFVVSASMITERAGPVVGALVSTLPISAGPVFVFLAIEYDSHFIAQSALGSLTINALTTVYALLYVLLAQKNGLIFSVTAALGIWSLLVIGLGQIAPSLPLALLMNAVALGFCIPLARRFGAVNMPLITRRWYDVPLRAVLVAGLVAVVLTLSRYVDPFFTGVFGTFPIVLTSLMLILHPRVGGRATAAVIANTLWGLFGFGLAAAALHVSAVPLGSPLALCLSLAVAAGWNMMLWQVQRRKRTT